MGATRRTSGVFSFESFVGGSVVGAAIVFVALFVVRVGDGPTDSCRLAEAPVISYVRCTFIEELPKAVVPTGLEPAEEFLLLAAYFLREGDAQTMRAELILAAMPASISSTPRRGGGAWHRVVVGPFASKSAAREALDELDARDIPAQMLVRPVARSESPASATPRG